MRKNLDEEKKNMELREFFFLTQKVNLSQQLNALLSHFIKKKCLNFKNLDFFLKIIKNLLGLPLFQRIKGSFLINFLLIY